MDLNKQRAKILYYEISKFLLIHREFIDVIHAGFGYFTGTGRLSIKDYNDKNYHYMTKINECLQKYINQHDLNEKIIVKKGIGEFKLAINKKVSEDFYTYYKLLGVIDE